MASNLPSNVPKLLDDPPELVNVWQVIPSVHSPVCLDGKSVTCNAHDLLMHFHFPKYPSVQNGEFKGQSETSIQRTTSAPLLIYGTTTIPHLLVPVYPPFSHSLSLLETQRDPPKIMDVYGLSLSGADCSFPIDDLLDFSNESTTSSPPPKDCNRS
jgi:hypothetical protein